MVHIILQTISSCSDIFTSGGNLMAPHPSRSMKKIREGWDRTEANMPQGVATWDDMQWFVDEPWS